MAKPDPDEMRRLDEYIEAKGREADEIFARVNRGSMLAAAPGRSGSNVGGAFCGG